MTLILNPDGTVSEITEKRHAVKDLRDEIKQINDSIEQINTERARIIEGLDANRAILVARKAELKALVDTIVV